MDRNYPDGAWELTDFDNNGWDRDLVGKGHEAASAFGCISSIVVHRGRIVASMGDLTEKVLIRSMRKSVLSALVGIEVERGRIRLDDTLRDLGIDDVEGLSGEEQGATIRHLLQARSGIYHPALAETKEMTSAKPPRGSKAPGTHWLYNNWDFNALGTIYERAAGQSVFEGVFRDIAEPLGMEDFTPADGSYLRGDQSVHPAYHMKMTSRDLARFGWLYLNDGNWNGRQVIPKSWVLESVKAHSFDGKSGYGYMWWTSGHDGEAQSAQSTVYRKHMPSFRYFAHGNYGQMIAVMPEKELVIAHLAQSRPRSAEESLKQWDYVARIMEAHANLA